LYRLSQSTHIRLLKKWFTLFQKKYFHLFRIVIFSKLSIINVNISIDGQYIGSAIRSIDNQNLFILPWNTSLYNDNNLHEILVEIKVKQRRKKNQLFDILFLYLRTKEIIRWVYNMNFLCHYQ
jgi:hypothetical protein